MDPNYLESFWSKETLKIIESTLEVILLAHYEIHSKKREKEHLQNRNFEIFQYYLKGYTYSSDTENARHSPCALV